MLDLVSAKKIYKEHDESSFFLKPSEFTDGISYTFQLISTEVALGYEVKLDCAESSFMFIPIDIPTVTGYNARAIISKIGDKSKDAKKPWKRLSVAVWSYIDESMKVLDLTGANVKRFFNAISEVEDPLRVKFVITRTGGKQSSYTLAIKALDNGKIELVDKIVCEKRLCLTNLFFKESVLDEPFAPLEDFMKLIK